jgi:hypothetical protein
VSTPPNPELDVARRELQELYRQLGAARPFSWSRMGTQRQIASVKRRIEQLEGEAGGPAGTAET